MNHLACGAFDQSSTFSHVLNQLSDRACSAQKPSGSRLAHSVRRVCSAALTVAFATNSARGGKRRVSFRTLVMFFSREDIVAPDWLRFGPRSITGGRGEGLA